MIEDKLVEQARHILVTKNMRMQLFQHEIGLVISLILYLNNSLRKTLHKITHFKLYKIILKFFQIEELRYIY